ncbi:hypothetical protein D9619_011106 [Psilocybe cf. subviscida]|uniref:Uncharacterized protein n=1 Tax=Psilocybe cf. subviscida TaxID=2480587 RepID=A0A8H5BJ38_9AGAR|nr:hypothetical protein D9619_011106 [Psilocybe cf. subviscida]
MLTSRAGLKRAFSPPLRADSGPLMSTMRIAAVLLLLIGLSTAMVQAAPVSTTPTTTAISAPCRGVTTYDIVQSQLKPNIAHTVPHHHRSAIDLSPPEPTVIAREETGIVVLVRRKSLGARIRAAFHKLGHKIKHAFQKVGHAIKHAAQKVGHFIKTTGAKIAKVGLKIAATVGKIAGKVIGFIPGAKGIGKAIEGGSEGLNKASDVIHAHIGGKLGKAMKRMDKAQKIVGYIP